MADTQRSLIDLLARLADNVAGDISEQDLRDLAVSIFGGYGGICVTGSPGAQGVNIAAAKLTAFDANHASSGVTPDHANDKLTIGVDADYHVTFDVSLLGSANRTFTFQLYKGGAPVAGAFTKRKLSGGTDVGSCSLQTVAAFVASDELDIRVSADQDGQSITIQSGVFSVKRAG
jgi:hypothetical protein